MYNIQCDWGFNTKGLMLYLIFMSPALMKPAQIPKRAWITVLGTDDVDVEE